MLLQMEEWRWVFPGDLLSDLELRPYWSVHLCFLKTYNCKTKLSFSNHRLLHTPSHKRHCRSIIVLSNCKQTWFLETTLDLISWRNFIIICDWFYITVHICTAYIIIMTKAFLLLNMDAESALHGHVRVNSNLQILNSCHFLSPFSCSCLSSGSS